MYVNYRIEHELQSLKYEKNIWQNVCRFQKIWLYLMHLQETQQWRIVHLVVLYHKHLPYYCEINKLKHTITANGLYTHITRNFSGEDNTYQYTILVVNTDTFILTDVIHKDFKIPWISQVVSVHGNFILYIFHSI